MLKRTKLTAVACVLPVITAVYASCTGQWTIVFNSLFTLFCIVAFFLTDRKFRLFSEKSYPAVLVFILMSVFAGRSLGLYEKVPYWDKGLHFLSGFILVIFAKRIYTKLNGNINNKAIMKIFSFTVAATGAAFWEIFEFTSDMIIGTTAQNNSLTDTMWDIILGVMSAFIGALFLR